MRQWLYVEAPFATFRSFTAGWFRPTATFLTPSAAYGLVLNLAGVESRLPEGADGHDGKTPATLTRRGLPSMKLALGVPATKGKSKVEDDPEAFPRVQQVYQQLHNYPVGASGKGRAADCRGNKYNITTVRREFLSDLRVSIGIEAESGFFGQLLRGLAGELARYGVPFLGDNNFLLDRAEVRPTSGECYWYMPVTEGVAGPQLRTARLTDQIDRADLSQTISRLYSPSQTSELMPPAGAWVTFSSDESKTAFKPV